MPAPSLIPPRSATMGSTDAARRAGHQAASAAVAGQHERNRHIRERIGRADLEQQRDSRRVMPSAASPPTRTPPAASASAWRSTRRRPRADGAERDADPDLARALPDHEGHHAVDPDRGEDEREHGEPAEQLGRETARAVAVARDRPSSGRRRSADRDRHCAHLARQRRSRASADPARSSSRATATGSTPVCNGRNRVGRAGSSSVLGAHVVDDADDRQPRVLRLRPAEMDAAADGILAGPVRGAPSCW